MLSLALVMVAGAQTKKTNTARKQTRTTTVQRKRTQTVRKKA